MTIKVLFIDDNDDPKFRQPFIEAAYSTAGLEVVWVQTWEEAKALINANRTEFKGLILDGKGQKDRNSKTEDDSYLNDVTKWLSAEAQRGFYMPYVVYTGFAEELKKFFSNEDIFWKDKNQEKELFEKLTEKISSTDLHRFQKLYSEPFNSIGGKYLPESCLNTFKDILKWSEEPTLTKNWFNAIRDLLEEMMKRANVIDNQNFLPDVFINAGQGGRPNITRSKKYWCGELTNGRQRPSVFNDHMKALFIYLVDIANITSHSILTGSIVTTLTIFTFRSCVNAMLELLTWYKDFIDTNYPALL